jgi:hypothetical protein
MKPVMNKLLFTILFSFAVLACFSQSKDTADLTKKVLALKNKNGKHLIFSDKDHKLYVTIKDGKMDYSAIDLEGKALGIKITPPIKGMSACVECVPISCPATSPPGASCQSCTKIPCP